MIKKIKTMFTNWFTNQLAKNISGIKMLLRSEFATNEKLNDMSDHYGTIIGAIAVAIKANPKLVAKGILSVEARKKLDDAITAEYEKLIDVPVKESKPKAKVVVAKGKKTAKNKGK